MRRVVVLLSIVIAAACRRTPPPPPAEQVDAGGVSQLAPPPAASTSAAPEATRTALEPPAAGAMIDIPAGTFASGSAQGDEGRDPTAEPALVPVTLDAYSIDALPHPNDPSVPATLGVSHEEAQRKCAERGARLCTELEWERACKGTSDDPFSTGAAWEPSCDKAPSRCASGFGVRGLGFLREWTHEGTVFRGGPGRRCAARPKAQGSFQDVGFRCCKGPRNAATVPPIETKPAFRKTKIDEGELARIFAKIPELARVGTEIKLFSDSDVKTIVGRSNAPPHEGLTFATTPLLWSPVSGAELLVATGRGKTMGFVVALWTLPKDEYRFASAFFLLNDTGPVALVYDPSRRRDLRWSACWGCSGEQGVVSYRDDHRVVVTQH